MKDACADDVFDSLFKNGYVAPFEWKNINRQTSCYNVTFQCEKCTLKSMHTFQVSVKDGVHWISGIALEIFMRLHEIKI